MKYVSQQQAHFAKSPRRCCMMFHYSKRIEVPCFCQPSEEPTGLEGQHPRRNCQCTRWYAGKGHGKHQKSVYSVHGQWGKSPIWCDFQNCVKQIFKCVLSLWNKKIIIIKTCFIAFWKKEAMLPHPYKRTVLEAKLHGIFVFMFHFIRIQIFNNNCGT